jgi:hypothetical protein
VESFENVRIREFKKARFRNASQLLKLAILI